MEREQVEWVFGLTGGELSDRGWSVVTADDITTRDGGDLREFPYWYEGAPEWATEDFSRDERHGASGERNIRTVVLCALYGAPPEYVWDVRDGARWHLEKFYSSSGECECPGRDMDDRPTKPDEYGHPISLVTRHEAKLTEKLPSNVRDPYTGKPYPRRAECVLCGERIGQPHAYIYLGDGWGEAVYVQETPTLEFEIIDHGVDGAQYFPGCGVAHTKYTHVALGVGDSAHEAGQDAIEVMCQGEDAPDDLLTDLEAALDKLPEVEDAHEGCRAEWRKDSGTPHGGELEEEDFERWHEGCEMHHYVSIQWRVVKH